MIFRRRRRAQQAPEPAADDRAGVVVLGPDPSLDDLATWRRSVRDAWVSDDRVQALSPERDDEMGEVSVIDETSDDGDGGDRPRPTPVAEPSESTGPHHASDDDSHDDDGAQHPAIRMENAVVALSAHASQLEGKIIGVERRLEELTEVLLGFATLDDVLDARLHTAKLAGEVARINVEIRAGLSQLSERIARADTTGVSDQPIVDLSEVDRSDVDLSDDADLHDDEPAELSAVTPDRGDTTDRGYGEAQSA